MGEHIDKLKTGNPDRKVTNQEFMNVLGEFLEESIAILDASIERMEPTIKKLESYNEEAQKPRQRLSQRLLRAICHRRGSQNAHKEPKL